MPFLDYNRDIPDGPNNPSDDQPLMKINTNSTDTIIAVDHAGFENNDGGYHTVIHQVIQGSDPAAIAGFNEVYAKNYTPDTTGGVADTQLFTRTGLGDISQLTGNKSVFNLAATSDGYQWVGGVLIQWGWVPYVFSGAVTFKDRAAGMIPFPNNCFAVVGTPTFALFGTQNNSIMIGIGPGVSITKTGFDYTFTNVAGTGTSGFNWIAIGN